MPEPMPIEVHQALADPTRYRLYRHLRLSGREVPIRELAARLSLHPNTLRPHLRRLEDAGLVSSESRRGDGVGRPQTVYAAVDVEGREGRDYRLLAEVLTGLLTTSSQRERAQGLAREWGAYLVGRSSPRPGARRASGPDLAVLRTALDEAGFTPRFRRRGATAVDITLRDCPFRDLLDEHRELVCAVHLGLIEGALGAARPQLGVAAFEPLADRRASCRVVAKVRRS
jgi:predicted ArsR family transcriptional regulator